MPSSLRSLPSVLIVGFFGGEGFDDGPSSRAVDCCSWRFARCFSMGDSVRKKR